MSGGRVSDRAGGWQRHALVAVLVLVALSPALAGDRFSVEVSLARNDLLSERLDLQRQLKDLDEEIRQAEKPVTVSGTVYRAQAVHGIRASHVERLRQQRQRLLGRVDVVDNRFARLTDRVVAHYGKRPIWWNDLK